MALIELNLEKPALKRTESTEQSSRPVARPPQAESTSEKTPESKETEEAQEAEEESGGGLLRRLAVIGALAGTVVAVRRWRKRRSASETDVSEFEEEWETASTE